MTRSTYEYQAAGGVVVDDTGERVLLLLRPHRPGPDGRPEVRLPKGHIEPGESHREAALREVREEGGLPELEIVADLGHQLVEFHWQDRDYRRDEFYFLMRLPAGAPLSPPEKQFKRLWLPWDEALARVTFEAEREWLRRAQRVWTTTQTASRR